MRINSAGFPQLGGSSGGLPEAYGKMKFGVSRFSNHGSHYHSRKFASLFLSSPTSLASPYSYCETCCGPLLLHAI